MKSETDPRIGVFICHCGGNISDTIDINKVRDVVRGFEDVKIAETDEYVCSTAGQNMIINAIKNQNINRVVVASCTPQLHLETFRQTVSEAALNPYLFEMVNLREQVSWVHDNVDQATAKAIDLIRGAVNRAKHLEELHSIVTNIKQSVLVIGGGIAGIQASIEMADKGYQVYLVERSPSIGGHMAQLSKTFPTFDCSYCILAPRMVSAGQHRNIELFTLAEPVSLKGVPGNYVVGVKERPRYIDGTKCTNCGECVKLCPIDVHNEFEEGLQQRKAIYIPFPQAVPRVYTIDAEHCLYLTKGVCKLCERVCKGGAIDFNQKERIIEFNVGAIIVSTGYEQIDPEVMGEYRHGWHSDIVTNLQFERIAIQGFGRPSDGKLPKKVAFVLCVGSRALTEGAVEYCCNIGCMAAIKQALLLEKAVSNAEPWIFYQDIRADGKRYEEFYASAREHNVKFVRGLAAQVFPSSNGLVIKAEDTISGTPIEETFDMVVLSTAIIPRLGTEDLSKILGLHLGSDNFLLESHYKLKPIDSSKDGIYLCGCVLSPKDIRESVLESMATASKAATFIGKGKYFVSPEIATIDQNRCDLCKSCISICPTNAIDAVDSEIKVNSISCIGCGACILSCPKEAIDLTNFTEEQLISQIRGVSISDGQEPKIIAFVERKTAYASLDLAGQTRLSYSPNVRIILIPSCMRIGTKHLLNALAYGADGIIFVEGDDSPFAGDQLRHHVIKLKNELRLHGVNSMRLASITTTIPEYNKVLNLFESFKKRILKLGNVTTQKRNKLKKNIANAL
ncbi:MAG: hydrogenase iron-sulfur subunit [Candidatus Bathyarchaeota archaeon]|nr:MAG: hydrogenase iron-sulfur subunit [Candidatus Bathyarchaeota archaeon]